MSKSFSICGDKAPLIRADATGKKQLATFEMDAYNGGPMTPQDWKNPVVCDLGGFVINNQRRPILRDHDHGKIIGHSNKITVGIGQPLKIFGVISGVGPDAQEVIATSKNDFPWQASIGADPIESEFFEAGRTVEVNGQIINGPVTVSWKTELGEISFVPLGADQTTSAKIAAKIEAFVSGFNETDHPRADDGKFGEGGGGSEGKKKSGGKGKKKEEKKAEPKEESASDKRRAADEADEIMHIYHSIRRNDSNLSGDDAYEKAKDEFKKQKSKRDNLSGSANSNHKDYSMFAKIQLKAICAAIRAGTYSTHEPMKFTDEEIDKMSTKEAQATLRKCMKAEDDEEGMEGADETDDGSPKDDKMKKDEEKKAEAANRNRIQASRKAEADEERRVIAIRAAAKKHGVSSVKIEANGKERTVPLVAHAIEAGWSETETELAAIKAARPSDGVGIAGGLGYSTNQPILDDRVLECAVFQASGRQFQLEDDRFWNHNESGQPIDERTKRQTLAEIKARYPDQVQQAAKERFPNGIGLQQVLTISARAHGYNGPETIRDDGTLEQVIRAQNWTRTPGIRADGASTASIANVLANVQNKYMLQGYMFVEQAWKEITQVLPVKDFKPTKSINLFGDFIFEQVPASGEIKNANLQDQAFANQADQYGKIITISRKDIINDDLGMLTTVPQMIGRGSALKLNKSFWSLWLVPGKDDGGGTDFWAATHTIPNMQGNSNLITGATSALSTTSLQNAQQTYDKQIDPVGYPLGIDAEILLYPVELEQTAWQLLNSSYIVMQGLASTSAATLQPSDNKWKGRYRPVKSRYLSNSSFTGYSTTAWWILANPNIIPAIQCCFLGGQEAPTVQQAGPDYQFNYLGISIRGVFDFGVNMQNFRSGTKSNGA